MLLRILPLSLLVLTALGPAVSMAQDVPEPAEPAADAAEPDQSAPAPKVEPSDGDPDWFNKMLARTTEPLPPIEVASEDGYFVASIPAKLLKPMEALEGVYLLTLDFGPGADAMAECYVYHDELDLAGSLMSFSEAIFDLIAAGYGEIELRAIYGVDAGGIGPVPYMGLDWLYRCKGTEATGPVAGQAKHLIAAKEGRALYCQSTAVGYDDAFFNVFKTLVTTIAYRDRTRTAPYYRELSLVSIADQVVGVAEGTHLIDQDGDIEMRQKMSMLLPVDQQSLQSQDSVSLEYSTVGGALISKVEVQAENGEVVTQLNLRQTEAGGWAVGGKFQGKELEADLGQADMSSDLEQRVDFRQLIREPALPASMSFASWLPDMDPTQVANTKITYLGPGEKGRSIKVESGPLSFTAVADEALSLLSMSMPIGATALGLERVYMEGDLFHPLELQASAAAQSEGGPEPAAAEGATAGQDSESGT